MPIQLKLLIYPERLSRGVFYLAMLTTSQHEALERIYSFLNGDDQVFILKGYAGTGKTYLMSYLADHLPKIGWNVYLLAPTGRAAGVLRKVTKKNARTIHSCIYNLDISNSTIVATEDASEYNLIFGLKHNEDPVNSIYIVDESSMLSNKKTEQDYLQFGSSKLLQDLMIYADVGSTSRKMLFVGDGAQLPPPNSNESVALNSEFLATEFKVQTQQFELTEVHRQKKESELLRQAHAIREKLVDENFEVLPISHNDKEIVSLGGESFIDRFICNWNRSIIIAASNRLVNEYNTTIRERFGYRELQIGERLLVTKNSHKNNLLFYNGEFLGVMQVAASREVKEFHLKEDGELKTVRLQFRDVLVSKRLEDGRAVADWCKILETTLYREEGKLSKLELRAIIVDFMQRYPGVKRGSEEFKSLFQIDPYVNGLNVRFGYAITCHKAQGGEWDEVFVDFDFYQSTYSELYFRWSYTAVTRAKEVVYANHLKRQLDNTDLFAGIQENLRVLLSEINYGIENVKHHDYQIIFSVVVDTVPYTYLLWYNKKKVITKIMCQRELREQMQDFITDKLQRLVGNSLFTLFAQ